MAAGQSSCLFAGQLAALCRPADAVGLAASREREDVLASASVSSKRPLGDGLSSGRQDWDTSGPLDASNRK